MPEKEEGRPTGPGTAPSLSNHRQTKTNLANGSIESMASMLVDPPPATDAAGSTRLLTEEGLLSPLYVLGTQDEKDGWTWDDVTDDVEQAPSCGFVFDHGVDVTPDIAGSPVVLVANAIVEVEDREVPTFKVPVMIFERGEAPADAKAFMAEIQGNHVGGILRKIAEAATEPGAYVTGTFADVLVSDDDQTRRELGFVPLESRLEDARVHCALLDWADAEKAARERRRAEAEEKERQAKETALEAFYQNVIDRELPKETAKAKLRIQAQRNAKAELDREAGLSTDHKDSARAHGLGSWLAIHEEEPEPIWGTRELPLWAPGESLMLVGPPSVGKSTLAHLLIWSLLGLKPNVLGFPVKVPAEDGGILYLAMDRPAQIRRAMQRLTRIHGGPTAELTDLLDGRVTVWEGPLKRDITDPVNQRYLVTMARDLGRSTIVVDSTKDVLPNASDEAKAGAYNSARQEALAEGLNWLELHHNRKANGESKEPNTLDDVYGSRWLTAGAGSVLSLYGQPGDIVVKLTHVKPLGEPLFPKNVRIDRESGGMSLYEEMTPELALLEAGPAGAPIKDLAMVLFDTKSPNKSQVENTRNKINRLIKDGKALEIPGSPTRYRTAGSGLEFSPGREVSADPFAA